jgi:hypothetical protein
MMSTRDLRDGLRTKYGMTTLHADRVVAGLGEGPQVRSSK